MKKVLFGIDNLLQQENKWKSVKFGLVTNNVAATSTGEPSRVALLKKGFTIVKLFSPEHGLTAKGEDGAYQSHDVDPVTHLPVISLYGDHLLPTEEDVKDIDALLFDIPDVGCRFYTYLWTMTYVMETCAVYKKDLLILDRPNPIGGDIDKAEGPMLDERNCSSFIGRWNIPVRHSCTLGELATYFAKTRFTDLHIEVIKVKNWNRNQTATEAGWPFIPTSPAIKDIETALLYPGMGLLEGIRVNEGRGTDWDFKVCGAPWINATELNNAFTQLKLPGIMSEAVSYIPAWGLYAGEQCNGLKFAVTDAKRFSPVLMALELLRLILSLYPDQCEQRLYPTVANPSGTDHLDKLTGVHHSFEKIKAGEILSTSFQPADWKRIIQPYLLY